MDSHRYLLDTNILSDLIRHPNGPVFKQLESALPDTACTSIVVFSEIQYGVRKSSSEKLKRQALQVLALFDVLPLTKPVAEHYGDIRVYLERQGKTIGRNDLFIASHARALDLTLVTANVREFSRVPDLRIENWLKPLS